MTAEACVGLLDRLDAKLKPIDVVRRLATARIATSAPAMARSMTQATAVTTALEHGAWTLFEGIKSIRRERGSTPG